jgi:diadenylate cyclase
VEIEGFWQIVSSVRWSDLVDIVVVAFIIYRIILLIRGTRTAQILLGFAILACAYLLSRWADLLTLNWILDHFLSYLILVILILFQDDIRKGLAQVGTQPRWLGTRALMEPQVIEEVVAGASALAERRHGAIIVLEREIGLRDVVERGVALDATVVRELIQSIFIPPSPVHDGALIVSRGRIIAAGCVLPLSSSGRLRKTLGTRHRAALGLSERSDAAVIVVSEERGKVSAAWNGKLYEDLTPLDLRGFLHEVFHAPEDKQTEAPLQTRSGNQADAGEER